MIGMRKKRRDRHGSVFKPTPHIVLVKKLWTDQWEYAPYLVCRRCTKVAAPEIDEADLYFDFGLQKRESATSFNSEEPVEYHNYYVLVAYLPVGSKEPKVAFIGVIPDEQRTLHRPDVATGQQQMKAYGIGYILSRWTFTEGHVGESGVHRTIGYMPDFNDKGLYGKAIFGNKTSYPLADAAEPDGSDASDEDGDENVYLFASDEQEEWNARDAVEYILWYRPNKEVFKFELAGQVGILQFIKRIWKTKGKSVWGLLNEIIDRKFGIGFYVRYNDNVNSDSDADFIIEVFSQNEIAIAVGNQVLDANQNIVSIEMPTTFPETHLVDAVPFRTNSLNRYDSIMARGNKIKLLLTFFNNDLAAAVDEDEEDEGPGDLTIGWTTSEQNAYRDVPGIDDKERDTARTSDAFPNVYQHFRVNHRWDWFSKPAPGLGGSPECCVPMPQPDGTILWGEGEGGYRSMYAKEFARDTCLLKGWDYTVYPAVDKNRSDATPAYVPLMALVRDNTSDPLDHEVTNNWYLVDKIPEAFVDDGCKGGHVTPLDRELGVKVKFHPPHYFALNTFDPYDTAHGSEHDTGFDYRKLLITGMFDTDAHFYVQVDLNDVQATKPELTKTLIIEAPDCEAWFPSRNTVIGVNATDQEKLQPIHPTYNEKGIRYDLEKLQMIAVIGAAWYGFDRQTIKIPIKQIGEPLEIGTMITSVDFITGQAPVRTVITAIETCFEHMQHITVETGYTALEPATMLDAFVPTKTFSGRGGPGPGAGNGGKINKGIGKR